MKKITIKFFILLSLFLITTTVYANEIKLTTGLTTNYGNGIIIASYPLSPDIHLRAGGSLALPYSNFSTEITQARFGVYFKPLMGLTFDITTQGTIGDPGSQNTQTSKILENISLEVNKLFEYKLTDKIYIGIAANILTVTKMSSGVSIKILPTAGPYIGTRLLF